MIKIPIENVTIKDTLQPRVQMNFAVVMEYEDAMKAGRTFPPIEIVCDGKNNWMWDGYHRLQAAKRAGRVEIEANITEGDLLHAEWLALSANTTHGFNRSNEDKRRAIDLAFRHPYAKTKSSNELSRHVGVDHKTVERWRPHLGSSQVRTYTTKHGTIATMNTANIGKTKPSPTTNLAVRVDDLFTRNDPQIEQVAQFEKDEQLKVVDLLQSGKVSTVSEADQFLHKRTKPKTVYPQDVNKSHIKDRCQTPYYATDIIVPYIPNDFTVWEPAKGKGFLVERLEQHDLKVVSGDILEGDNFFDYEPDQWDCLVTNPPFSTKFQFLERCYHLGKPFALLMPFEAFLTKSGLTFFKQYGVELVVPDARIDYEMPFEGYINGNSPFASMWFTWGLGLPNQINYAEMDKSNIGPLNISERSRNAGI